MPKIIDNLREKIVDVGRNILINGKYKDFNIREIARKCEIGTGTVYNYFQNKEQLAREIFRSDWSKTLGVIDYLKNNNRTLKDKLYGIYCSLEVFIHSYMGIFIEMAAEKGESSSNPDKYYRDIFVTMEEFIENEKNKENIKSDIASDKLSHFIISNMIYSIRDKYIDFEELYKCMRLNN